MFSSSQEKLMGVGKVWQPLTSSHLQNVRAGWIFREQDNGIRKGGKKQVQVKGKNFECAVQYR